MKRLLLVLSLWLGLLAPSYAVIQTTRVGDAAYTMLNTDVLLTTSTAFTAARTWTLPFAAGTCIGQNCAPLANQLWIMDTAAAITATNTLTIAPQSGDTINGSTSSVVINYANATYYLLPTSANNWLMIETAYPGQLPATVTNDSASAGNLGETLTTGICPGSGTTATVTMTIAAPGVVTWTTHGMTGACPVVFTTSGALPTGITSGTTYWIVPSTITTSTFQVATTVANALAGTAITTSGSQSGTQTGTAGSPLTTTTAANITGVTLTAGDWDCRGNVGHVLGASTSVTIMSGSLSTTTATVGTRGGNGTVLFSTAANVMGVGGQDLQVGPVRQSVAVSTPLYLVAQDTFTVSTDVAFGTLTCRRER